MQETINYELNRLNNLGNYTISNSLGYVNIHVICDLNVLVVINNVKEVLLAIDSDYANHQWDSWQYWEKVLPEWFLKLTAPEDNVKNSSHFASGC